MHYMILMSKKMTSQKKLVEIKSVPYNKPLYIYKLHVNWSVPKNTNTYYIVLTYATVHMLCCDLKVI